MKAASVLKMCVAGSFFSLCLSFYFLCIGDIKTMIILLYAQAIWVIATLVWATLHTQGK